MESSGELLILPINFGESQTISFIWNIVSTSDKDLYRDKDWI